MGDPATAAGDLYAANGEFYAAVGHTAWDAYASTLPDLLAPALTPDPTGAIVDLGAGVGLGTVRLARWFPQARLHAVEPSPVMRTGCMTAIVVADLQERATLWPGDLDAALPHLPGSWAALVIANAVGHLHDDARARLWRACAERLAPTGRLVVALQPPPAPGTIPETDFGTVTVGDLRYATSGACRPAGEREVMWSMRWRVGTVAGGAPLREVAEQTRWTTLGPDELTAELAPAGLAPAASDPATALHAFGHAAGPGAPASRRGRWARPLP